MTYRLAECCSVCPSCRHTCCYDTWPTNRCRHGGSVCEECYPGECAECATEAAKQQQVTK